MDAPWYATLEATAEAPDYAGYSSSSAQLRRAVEAASRMIDGVGQGAGGLLSRRFYPSLRTLVFDAPHTHHVRRSRYDRYGRSHGRVLDFQGMECRSVSAVTVSGTLLDPSAYELEPADQGPPYDGLRLTAGGYGSWPITGTGQDAFSITGEWGSAYDRVPAGALVGALTNVATTLTHTSAGSALGTGTVLQIGTELLIVTDRGWLSTGQALTAELTGSTSDTVISVADGTLYSPGDLVQVDGETLRVRQVVANKLVVERAADGSNLADHLIGATLYARRTATVLRGQLGSTAAAHNNADPITAVQPPALITALCIAEAINVIAHETGGGSAVQGTGSSTAPTGGGGLADLRAKAVDAYGQQTFVAV